MANVSAQLGPVHNSRIFESNKRAWTFGLPTPLNNQIAITGDSRTASSTGNAALTEPTVVTVYGYLAWLLVACGYRVSCVGNYGINAQTLDDITARLSANPTVRGNILSSTAGTFIFLGGVNDGSSPIGTTGPKYINIINQLTAAGKICIVLNELPNNDAGPGNGATHLGRRTFLDGAVYSNGNRAVKFNSYDIEAVSPSSFFSKAGYFGDTLHPNLKGYRALGEGIATLVNTLFSSYPLRNVLAGSASTTAPFFNGTAGNLGGNSGQIADNWTSDAAPAGLTIVYSKSTDAGGYQQQVVTVTGTPSAAIPTFAQFGLNCFTVPGTSYVSGDTIYHGVSVGVDAGSVGLAAVEIKMAASDNTNSVFINGASFNTNIFDNASTTTQPWLSGDYQGDAFSGVVISPGQLLGAGWTASVSKSVGPSVLITFRGGSPVNAVIRLSRSTVLKNI
jgi:lysophospholipase L1-like esterase